MSNERAKLFEEWFDEYPGNVKGANRFIALAAWQKRAEIAESERQASRVAALEEAEGAIKSAWNGCSDLRDVLAAIRSLAEAPTKEK